MIQREVNFLAINSEFIRWSSEVTQLKHSYLKNISGITDSAAIGNRMAVTRDFTDFVLANCTLFRTKDTSKEYKTSECAIHLKDGNYVVNIPEMVALKLLKLDRANSTHEEMIIMHRSKATLEWLKPVLQDMIRFNVFSFETVAMSKNRPIIEGCMSLLTNVYLLDDYSYQIKVQSEGLDLLVPKTRYGVKYLTDSMVLSGEYCKNFHSMITNFCLSIRKDSGKYFKVSTLAEYCGIRYDETIRSYDKSTGSYSRTEVIQHIKRFINEINSKTSLPSIYGKLSMVTVKTSDLQKDESEPKPSKNRTEGIKFYFEV